MMRRLLRPLWLLLAAVFLIEAWLWERLRPLVAAIVRLVAWRELREKAARAISRIPPYAALLVFLVPVVLLFPIKLMGFWLLARGHWLGAMATLGAAKVVSMGVTAFIFEVTRPKLLELGWFRWVYEHVMRGLAWAHRHIDPIKARLKVALRAATERVQRRMRALVWLARPGRSGRLFRRLLWLRRRAQRPAPPAPASLPPSSPTEAGLGPQRVSNSAG